MVINGQRKYEHRITILFSIKTNGTFLFFLEFACTQKTLSYVPLIFTEATSGFGTTEDGAPGARPPEGVTH